MVTNVFTDSEEVQVALACMAILASLASLATTSHPTNEELRLGYDNEALAVTHTQHTETPPTCASQFSSNII